MKRDRSSVDKRRMQILKLIREEEEVRVEDLAKRFRLSLMTARRDLQYLEDRHLIKRFYGGATVDFLPKAMTPEEEVQTYRRLIARFASTMVEEGDTLFINGSRTALGLLDYISNFHIHVITNNGWVIEREYPEEISITLTGGNLRGHLMVGDYVMRNLLNASADKAFLGCAGVYDNGEFLYNIPTEIGINEVMISRTVKQIYMLADYTKLIDTGEHGDSYGSCSYERPVTLITDERADEGVIKRLQARGVTVHQVGLEDALLHSL